MKISSFQIIEQEIFPEENRLALYKESYPLSVVEREGRIFLTIASPIFETLSGRLAKLSKEAVTKVAIPVHVLRNGMAFVNTPKHPMKFVGSVNLTKVEKKQLLHLAREQWVDVSISTTHHVFWGA